MCVVILSGHSLFADGIAARLQDYLSSTDLRVVHPTHPDAMDALIQAQPAIIILDVTDTDAIHFYTSNKLLYKLPVVRVIRLDPQEEQIRVLTSECHPAIEVKDLLDIIQYQLTREDAEACGEWSEK